MFLLNVLFGDCSLNYLVHFLADPYIPSKIGGFMGKMHGCRGLTRIFKRGFPKAVFSYQSRGLGMQPQAIEKV